jgi:asparagine synthase (glutamine-hydrolysing)
MSGINGFNLRDSERIEAMNEVMAHARADRRSLHTSTHMDDALSLGCVFFEESPIACRDQRGMNERIASNEEGDIYAVFDGEIYNDEDLRNHLGSLGHRFETNLDVELVIHAYEEHGLEFANKLEGIWALAIYDRGKNKLILSRDPFGAKPLYWHTDGLKFVFSSEIKSIFVHQIRRTPNYPAIFDYLLFIWSNHPEQTFFKGINELLPAHSLIFSLKSRRLVTKRYYQPTGAQNAVLERVNSQNCLQSPAETTQTLIIRSVRKRVKEGWRSPIGACLSGGLDSSTIVCVSRLLFPETDIHVFSLGFPGKECDESMYQEAVVEETRSKWNMVSSSGRDMLKEVFNMVYIQELPIVGPACFGQYLIFKKAHDEGFRVLLDGMAADGLFAGLPWVFGYYLYELAVNLKLGRFLQEAREMAKIYGVTLPLRQFMSVLLVNSLSRFFPAALAELFWHYRGRYLNRTFLKKHSHRARETLWRASSLQEILDNEGLGPLALHPRYTAKNSTYWGLRLRYPFADRTLLDYALKIPSELKISHGIRKAILREAMKGILPEQVLERTDKKGGDVPEDIINDPSVRKFVSDIISSERFKSRACWDYERVQEMMRQTIAQERDWSSEIWKMVFLELWFRVWIEESPQRRQES